MVYNTYGWLDEELTFPAGTLEGGGVAIHTQTLLLEAVHSEEPVVETPETEEAQAEPPTSEVEEQKTPEKTETDRPRSALRHLAGANWLDDWTAYFPPGSAVPPRKKPDTKRK